MSSPLCPALKYDCESDHFPTKQSVIRTAAVDHHYPPRGGGDVRCYTDGETIISFSLSFPYLHYLTISHFTLINMFHYITYYLLPFVIHKHV